jgi:flagellar basal-body rod protein FlgC
MGMLNVFDIAGSALTAQSLRLNVTASNLANAQNVAGDPAEVYRARHLVCRAEHSSFAQQLAGAGVSIVGIVESSTAPLERFDPGHPEANDQGIVYAANVNPMAEMADMISASRSYQTNLEVLNSAKDLMYRTLSLGQG